MFYFRSYSTIFYKMLSLLSIDAALGRLDYDSLSDQTLMEILMENSGPYFLHDKNGNFTDACSWDYVSCENGRVTHLQFEKCYLWSQFEFGFIPPLVRSFTVLSCDMRGTLDTSLLPRNLELFDVGFQKMSGTLDWKSFPRKLRSIDIKYNLFTGSIVLSDLPNALVYLEVLGNRFSGELSFRELPPSLYKLNLSGNELTGPITIDEVHNQIYEINLGCNFFSGDFRLLVVPPKLKKISVIENDEMSGTAVLPKSLDTEYFRLWYDGIKAVHDEDGNKHPWESKILESNDPVKDDAMWDRLR